MTGRPTKEFDWSKLDAILQYNAQLQDCAEVMDVSEDTIARRIRDKYDVTFAEYRSKKLGKVRIMLVQRAIEQAKNGSPAMMIFCLKNLCGWMDRREEHVSINKESYEEFLAGVKVNKVVKESKKK